MNWLFVCVQRPQNCSRVYVKNLQLGEALNCRVARETHLNQTTVIPGDDKLAVRTHATTACNILEARDRFCHLLGPGGVDLDPSGCSDSIAVGFGSREMDGGDWSILLDKDRVLELAPVSGFWGVF